MNKSSTEEVNNSLIEVKTLISAGSWDFIPRKKNMDCLAELGLSKRNAIDIIRSLTYKDYENGPTEDYNSDHIGFLWVFGKDECEFQVYIKLKIKDTTRGNLLSIMGFHKAQWKINYFYR